MFAKTWREHWGLQQDPFDCEDADKDLVLARIDTGTVPTGFDRLFGSPLSPAPGVIFGEKGSGKSGLRRMMRRRLEEHNRAQPEHRVFAIEYTDFDTFFEHFRRAAAESDDEPVAATLERWRLADHLDAILSVGVTELAHECLARSEVPAGLTEKQRVDFLVLVALYHHSARQTASDALRRLRGKLGARSARRGLLGFARVVGTLAGVGLLVAPLVLQRDDLGPRWAWWSAGLALLAATWLWTLVSGVALRLKVARAERAVRVLAHDPRPLIETLGGLPPGMRAEFALPHDGDEGIRYDLLHRFLELLEAFGYESCYVLMDRVDEPSFLGADPRSMRAFVEHILDHKLLQYPRLALKLFLPIELDEIHRNASPEELKRMRLDKSNLVAQLKWSGTELYEIANRRLRVCLEGDARAKDLASFFQPDLAPDHVRDTLQRMGTPRYTFSFLSSLFTEYMRELPDALEPGSPLWRIPRAHFDLVRAGWLDRSELLRRTLN